MDQELTVRALGKEPGKKASFMCMWLYYLRGAIALVHSPACDLLLMYVRVLVATGLGE